MTVVLDASALLAVLFSEPGADDGVAAITDGAVISAVNLAEVATVLLRRKLNPKAILDPVVAQVPVEEFSEVDVLAVAALYPLVSAKGLSFGDRACLALAQRLAVTALTADQSWLGLSHGVSVRVIRMAR